MLYRQHKDLYLPLSYPSISNNYIPFPRFERPHNMPTNTGQFDHRYDSSYQHEAQSGRRTCNEVYLMVESQACRIEK